jgi:hypothetical protein
LLTPPAEAAASQKWKIIYLQVLMVRYFSGWIRPNPTGNHLLDAFAGVRKQNFYKTG